MNIDDVGKTTSSIDNPATLIMHFDSTDLTWSAIRSTRTLPNPTRYSEGNTVAYADGHVQGVTAAIAKRVR